MRVIAGRLGGRSFDSPRGRRTHPMSDKARGALFNSLGDINGLTVLDAFAGSGALAYEALSRGAAAVTMIESDRLAQSAITENIAALQLKGSANLVKSRVQSWLATSSQLFDIVLADSPYNELQLSTVATLAGRVRLNGLLVVSLPPKAKVLLPDTMELLRHKNYGDAELLFYRRAN